MGMNRLRPLHLFALGLALEGALVTDIAAQEPVTTEVHLDTGTGVLGGSLVVPAGRTPLPVALLIAGSGPTDRDGNSAMLGGRNNSLRQLAEVLAANGIASLRYDKRGIGASAGAFTSEAALRFDNYVDDAARWITQLRADPRFSTITVIGHSEGSLIGMIAARTAGADAYVSMAGPARSAGAIIRDQIRPSFPAESYQLADSILSELEAGRTFDGEVPRSLAMLFRPSVQPYLVSWLRYVPAAEVARLTVPVLIIQGTTDIQVGTGEATALKSAQPAAQLELIDGMNHVLKQVPPDHDQQVASYSNPSLELSPRLGPLIVAFIRGVPARANP